MLIEKDEKYDETQHYCWIKRLSALLYSEKGNKKRFFCQMCLSRFKRNDVLVNHQKYCNGVNGRPTRIEMPTEDNNILSFQNYHKQMKALFVVYADFEAVIDKIEKDAQ